MSGVTYVYTGMHSTFTNWKHYFALQEGDEVVFCPSNAHGARVLMGRPSNRKYKLIEGHGTDGYPREALETIRQQIEMLNSLYEP